MASPRALVLVLLAFFGAALVLQVVAEDSQVFVSNNVQTSRSSDLSEEVDELDEQSPATYLMDTEVTKFDALDDASDNGNGAEAGEQSESVDLDEDSTSGAGPLARVLQERFSKQCYTANYCKRFFQWPGCCKEKCADLSTDNNNCGKCGNCCDTKNGYCCINGSCTKPKPKPKPHNNDQCNRYKKCNSGKSCCSTKCVSLWSDSWNCGKCGVKCRSGTSCCSGKCVSLWSDSWNCGKCGVKCRYGQKCCSGQCVDVLWNWEHCGRCNQKCKGKCEHGMCEYNSRHY